MQTPRASFLFISLSVLFICVPYYAYADGSSVDSFTAIVNTGPVKQTTQGSSNQQNLNVGSVTSSRANSFNATVTTGAITQSSSGSGIVQNANIGSLTNSKAGSFNSTVNTGNIEQIATQSGQRQELDLGSVTNSTVSGSASTNVTIKDGVRQTGSGEIAIGSVKNSNVQNFSNTISVQGKVSGNNIKMGSVVGQGRYDSNGEYAGQDQAGDSGTNNSLNFPKLTSVGSGGAGTRPIGTGTTYGGKTPDGSTIGNSLPVMPNNINDNNGMRNAVKGLGEFSDDIHTKLFQYETSRLADILAKLSEAKNIEELRKLANESGIEITKLENSLYKTNSELLMQQRKVGKYGGSKFVEILKKNIKSTQDLILEAKEAKSINDFKLQNAGDFVKKASLLEQFAVGLDSAFMIIDSVSLIEKMTRENIDPYELRNAKENYMVDAAGFFGSTASYLGSASGQVAAPTLGSYVASSGFAGQIVSGGGIAASVVASLKIGAKLSEHYQGTNMTDEIKKAAERCANDLKQYNDAKIEVMKMAAQGKGWDELKPYIDAVLNSRTLSTAHILNEVETLETFNAKFSTAITGNISNSNEARRTMVEASNLIAKTGEDDFRYYFDKGKQKYNTISSLENVIDKL